MTALPKPWVSPSQITKFFGKWGCELNWYYTYVERIRTVTTARLYIGTSWDKSCNVGHEKVLAGEDATPDLLADTFVDTWRNPPETDREGLPVDYDLSEANDNIETIGAGAARDYAHRILPHVDPIETQRKVELGFDETDVKLTGFVDLTERAGGGLVITDNKASMAKSAPWTLPVTGQDVQLRLYDLMLDAAGELVVARGFRGAHLLKTKHTLHEQYVVSRPEDRAQTLGLLGSALSRMESACESGVFLPTAAMADSWKCSAAMCPFFEKVCPYGKRGRVAVAFGQADEDVAA